MQVVGKIYNSTSSETFSNFCKYCLVQVNIFGVGDNSIYKIHGHKHQIVILDTINNTVFKYHAS